MACNFLSIKTKKNPKSDYSIEKPLDDNLFLAKGRKSNNLFTLSKLRDISIAQKKLILDEANVYKSV